MARASRSNFKLKLRTAVLAGASLLLACTGWSSAQAGVTLGDVQALFEADPNGAITVFTHAPEVHGFAEYRGLLSLAIITPILDDRHYCAEDWHLIALRIRKGNAPDADPILTNLEIREFLLASSAEFVLDGESLDVVQSEPKPWNPSFLPNQNDAMVITFGVIMHPARLSVGIHSLKTDSQFGDEAFHSDIEFEIDAPGTGVCAAGNDALKFREVQ